jgi:hypothetical protein
MVQPPPFVYGPDELLLTILPVLIVLFFVGPKWLRERKLAAEAEEKAQPAS